jgi:hypothetical protein
MPLSALHSLLPLLLVLPAARAQAQCYFPSGNKTYSGYTPCSADPSDPLSTICCNSEIGDACLPNGLCAVSGWPVAYWRKFCTEKDWTTGKCLDACIMDVSDTCFVDGRWKERADGS